MNIRIITATAFLLATLPALAGDGGNARSAPSVETLVKRLGHEAWAVRTDAVERLYLAGARARPALEEAAGAADPHRRRLARRLLLMIRWRIPPKMRKRIGPLWDDFEALPPRKRVRRLLELQALKEEIAVRLLERTAEIDPHSAVKQTARRILAALVSERLSVEGDRLLDEGKHEPAEARFREILALDPVNPKALYGLARSRLLQGDRDAALRFLRKAASAGFEAYVVGRLNTDGCRLLPAEDFETAETYFGLMLEIDPVNSTALYNIACSRSLQGKTDEALDFLTKSIRHGYRNFEHIRQDPDFENIREDPRFERLLRGGWRRR